MIAAFLWAQLEEADRITLERLERWDDYHRLMAPLEARGLLRRPVVPDGCTHNAHMYYVLLASDINRQDVLDAFRQNDIGAVFHYVPLHASPAGRRYGRASGPLPMTVRQSERLIRLPLWLGITQAQQEKVLTVLEAALGQRR